MQSMQKYINGNESKKKYPNTHLCWALWLALKASFSCSESPLSLWVLCTDLGPMLWGTESEKSPLVGSTRSLWSPLLRKLKGIIQSQISLCHSIIQYLLIQVKKDFTPSSGKLVFIIPCLDDLGLDLFQVIMGTISEKLWQLLTAHRKLKFFSVKL